MTSAVPNVLPASFATVSLTLALLTLRGRDSLLERLQGSSIFARDAV